MKRNELEKIYQRQGCRDYHLRDAQDLLTVHRVDFTTVKGYTELTDENKVLYCAFIVNYWNAYGLDTRMTMISKGIYFVEDQEFDYHYTNPYDGREMAATAKREIKVILASGKKRTLHKYVDKDFVDKLPLVSGKPSQYLRFEYKINGRNEWMHVKSPTQWY